jgi:hypothetical protein
MGASLRPADLIQELAEPSERQEKYLAIWGEPIADIHARDPKFT